jgi:hypothetical protein
MHQSSLLPIAKTPAASSAAGRGDLLQRKSDPASARKRDSAEAPPIVHEVLRSSGQPLDPAARAFMEPRFGYDFSRVRVHSDSQAAKSAESINAQAYTVGSNIVFGTNRGGTGNQSHRRLLAHELAHVVQQRGKTDDVPRTISTIGEKEAVSASEAVTAGHPVRVGPVPSLGLQRDTQTYDQAKQSVLDELHRSQPAAIIPMLDFMDAPIRTQMQKDPDVLNAIKALPKGSQDIVMKHLMQAAPASPQGQQAPAQPKPAEQIPTAISSDYESFGLHGANARQAVSTFGQTVVANRLVEWLAQHNIQYKVQFLARRKDLPRGKGEGGGVDGTYEQTGQRNYTIYVMGSNVVMAKDWTTTDDPSDRNSEAMSKTIFHELLHVWFINARPHDPNDPYRTGHTSNVQPPSIGIGGGTNYDVQNYDPEFLAALRAFDAEVAARKLQAAPQQP